MKRIAVLGCTGSIGTTALSIIRAYPNEFSVRLLANEKQYEKLLFCGKDFPSATLYCKNRAEDKEYLERAETYEHVDMVINGIDGINGLMPSVAALTAGKILVTANKESLVCAGEYINNLRKRTKGQIYPIDSEHSAVWQCVGDNLKSVKKIILTASGGAFRDYSKEMLSAASGEDALRHPNWKMGKKVTVDCATLMNKGMELIEAKRLFGIDAVEAILHRQSVIHAFVETVDNGMLCAMSMPDMTLPIQYALFYPDRMPSSVQPLDPTSIGHLDFEKIDEERFPCFSLCKNVLKQGDISGTVLNSADEVLVKLFLDGKCRFYDISDRIERALTKFGQDGFFTDVKDLFRMDKEVREYILSDFCL